MSEYTTLEKLHNGEVIDLEGSGDVSEWIIRPTQYDQAATEWERIKDDDPVARQTVETILRLFHKARIEAVTSAHGGATHGTHPTP